MENKYQTIYEERSIRFSLHRLKIQLVKNGFEVVEYERRRKSQSILFILIKRQKRTILRKMVRSSQKHHMIQSWMSVVNQYNQVSFQKKNQRKVNGQSCHHSLIQKKIPFLQNLKPLKQRKIPKRKTR